MICPFCRQSDIVDNSGKTICPDCKTVFEIDERVKQRVFAGTDSKNDDFCFGKKTVYSECYAEFMTTFVYLLRKTRFNKINDLAEKMTTFTYQ